MLVRSYAFACLYFMISRWLASKHKHSWNKHKHANKNETVCFSWILAHVPISRRFSGTIFFFRNASHSPLESIVQMMSLILLLVQIATLQSSFSRLGQAGEYWPTFEQAVAIVPRGGRGHSTKFYTGRLRPKVQTLTFLCTIFDRKLKVPLSYTFHRKWYAFHIPTERLLLNFSLEKTPRLSH